MKIDLRKFARGVAVGAFLLSTYARAQVCQSGELRVRVVDSQESDVYDATVRAVSKSVTLGPRSTGASGTADFEAPCGVWEITVSKDGFENRTRNAEITNGAAVEVRVVVEPKSQAISIDVDEKAPPVEQSASQNHELKPVEVKTLPSDPATVNETLPLVPGIVRTPDGELKIDGNGQERSAMVVNLTDITDPATGKFGQGIPIDAVETVNVLTTPFLAQYGRFTQSVVAVETKRGGEKWHADIKDPFPDFRIRSYHMRGIRNETPRFTTGGPLIKDKLYFAHAMQYFMEKAPNRTLPFPFNEQKTEWINSFSQVDWNISKRQLLTGTFHLAPQHINFVNPEFFNPQVVSPSLRQHNYVGTLIDHYGLLGGLLDSTYSVQRFDVNIGAQGPAGMIMTPTGNRGNYFGTQNRDAERREWLETMSFAPVNKWGTHLFKTGTSLTYSSNQGQFSYRDIDILNALGRRTQRIGFTNLPPFNRTDREFTYFVQDHWSPAGKLSFDYGARVESQRLTENVRVGPRIGMALNPFGTANTVLRMGYGLFYDHLPLDLYTFGRYPLRTITNYGPNGAVIGTPIQYLNVIGDVRGPRSFFVGGQAVSGGFSPRGATLNLQLEHAFNRTFRFRAVYTDNRSVGLVVLEPDRLGNDQKIVLNGEGSARYRQFEATARATWKGGELTFSYTHANAQGSLNTYDTFLGNYPMPLVRPNVYSKLPADLPNRFLTWGHIDPHFWKFQLYPILEYRSGFPYATYDEAQNYSGVPYRDSTRYPRFFSADSRLVRDFKVNPKYTVRLSLTTYNMTNHFNALSIHNNTADPQYGIFFGNYHRRYRGDFEIVF